MWLLLWKRLPTKESVSKWSNDGDWCPVCLLQAESQLHVLRDCPRAMTLWKSLVPSLYWNSFFDSNWRAWLRCNLLNHTLISDASDWPEIFSLSCWFLWNWRNLQVHGKEELIPVYMGTEVLQFLLHRFRSWSFSPHSDTQLIKTARCGRSTTSSAATAVKVSSHKIMYVARVKMSSYFWLRHAAPHFCRVFP